MAQFDVYPNPNEATRDLFPFLLDIQSPVISDIATRIVLPLGKAEHFNDQIMQTLTPIVEYEDMELILLTPQIASVPSTVLSNPVGSLAHFRREIIGALDFAITGI